MTNGRKASWIRRTHSTAGWLLATLILVVAGTGILLQHPGWLGPAEDVVLCLAADPSDADRWLRGTHWGVEVSNDGGRNWREADMLAPPTDVLRIIFGTSPGQDSMVYALGTDGLVFSSDGGRIWDGIPLPTPIVASDAEVVDLALGAGGSLQLLSTIGVWQFRAGEGWRSDRGSVVPTRNRRQWVHDLHTGNLFGLMGRRVAEGAAWGLVLVTLTGLLLVARVRRRRRK